MNLSDAVITTSFIHYVGSPLLSEGIQLSKRKVDVSNSDIQRNLCDFYLAPFLKSQGMFQFTHPSSLKFNEVFNYTCSLFEDVAEFPKVSGEIAQHLYDSSSHPKVKGGELHIVRFENCRIDDRKVDAIGIFKTETKTSFVKLNNETNGYIIEFEQGINVIDGFDKGCLVFNVGKKDGFKVCVMDTQNRSAEAQYWKDAFLKVKPTSDSFHQTQNFLNTCKEFISDRFPQEFEVSKTDQIDMLNKSLGYFKENDAFEERDFTKSVLVDPEVIKSFKKFRTEYAELNEFEAEDNFDVSGTAVKKQARAFKSVLKLDKNFHIYIHGDRELIHKGVDKDGKKFYKIYYDEEA